MSYYVSERFMDEHVADAHDEARRNRLGREAATGRRTAAGGHGSARGKSPRTRNPIPIARLYRLLGIVTVRIASAIRG